DLKCPALLRTNALLLAAKVGAVVVLSDDAPGSEPPRRLEVDALEVGYGFSALRIDPAQNLEVRRNGIRAGSRSSSLGLDVTPVAVPVLGIRHGRRACGEEHAGGTPRPPARCLAEARADAPWQREQPCDLALGYGAVDHPPQLLTDEGPGILLGLAQEPLVALGEAFGVMVPLRLELLDHLGLHPVYTARSRDLALDRRLQPKQLFELTGLRQHRRQKDLIVLGAETDYPPVALHDPLRIPGHVVRDHGLGLLKVVTLAENIGGEQEVDLALRRLVVGPHDRPRSEPPEGGETLVRLRLGADHGDSVAPPDALGQVFVEVADRRRVGREHGHLLRRRLLEQAPQRGELGIACGIEAGEICADREQALSVGGDVGSELVAELGPRARPTDLELLVDPRPQTGLVALRLGRICELLPRQHLAALPSRQERVVDADHSLHGFQARHPAGLEALQQPRLQQAAELDLNRAFLGANLVGAWTVARHREGTDCLRDALEQSGMRPIEVIAQRGEPGAREPD